MKNLLITALLFSTIICHSQGSVGSRSNSYDEMEVATYQGSTELDGIYQRYFFKFTASCLTTNYYLSNKPDKPKDKRPYYHVEIIIYYFSVVDGKFKKLTSFLHTNQDNKYYDEYLDNARLYLINEVLKIKP